MWQFLVIILTADSVCITIGQTSHSYLHQGPFLIIWINWICNAQPLLKVAIWSSTLFIAFSSSILYELEELVVNDSSHLISILIKASVLHEPFLTKSKNNERKKNLWLSYYPAITTTAKTCNQDHLSSKHSNPLISNLDLLILHLNRQFSMQNH